MRPFHATSLDRAAHRAAHFARHPASHSIPRLHQPFPRSAFRALVATTLLVIGAALHAAENSPPPRTTGPVFTQFGPVLDVEPDYLPPITPYKVQFDVWIGPEATDAPNPRLETLARFMNMNARQGIAVEDMRLAVVLHGTAGRAVLEDDAYRARFGTSNPDRALLDALAAKGVRMLICGQSAAARGYRKAEMIEPVQVAVSAYTAILGLEQEGYRLMPAWE